jgi:predicted ATP-binding protein involved in virulence
MDKKKVTLSLERDVVDQAKKQNLNMSKAANKALKERTVLEKLSEDERELRDIIEDAREDGAVESLPMKIEELQIENIGKFETKNFSLSSEDTVILGPNSSGKTTLTRALKAFFGKPDQDLINFQENSGKIEVETEQSSGSMTLSEDRPVQGECLVLDNIFAELSTEKAVEAAQKIKENYSEQIILATNRRKVADEFENQIRLTSYSENRLAELREKLNEKDETLTKIKQRYSKLDSLW